MRVKRYVAGSAELAVAQVRAELGPEAIILHTQPVHSKGIFGFLARPRFEVLAAVDDVRRAVAQAVPAHGPAPLRRAAPDQSPPAVSQSAAALGEGVPRVPEQALAALQHDVGQMATLMGRLMRRLDLPGEAQRLEPEFRGIFTALTESGLPEDMALRVLGRVRRQVQKGQGTYAEATDLAVAVVAADLGQPIPISVQRGSRRVVALVGPTGVGKTTTLAKLAAHHALGRRLKVALITADTYRIAAVEQLRTYAEIIGVPLQVVAGIEELPAAVARCAGVEVILVDTAGRSHRDEAQMADLASLLQALEPDETHLVLSLTASGRDLEGIAKAYMPMGFDRFLLTKLDEACAPGTAYTLVQRFERPLSYLTGGQNVPDDIEVASPEKLARRILGV